MDLKQYYQDLRKEEARLNVSHLDGIVYVTSLFHREKNSTPGHTITATCFNAARVITDGTHRESTDEEIKQFLAEREADRVKTVKSEQMKKRQYIVVVDQHQPSEAMAEQHIMAPAARPQESKQPAATK